MVTEFESAFADAKGKLAAMIEGYDELADVRCVFSAVIAKRMCSHGRLRQHILNQQH